MQLFHHKSGTVCSWAKTRYDEMKEKIGREEILILHTHSDAQKEFLNP